MNDRNQNTVVRNENNIEKTNFCSSYLFIMFNMGCASYFPRGKEPDSPERAKRGGVGMAAAEKTGPWRRLVQGCP